LENGLTPEAAKRAARPKPPHDDWQIIWGGLEFEGIRGVEIVRNVANFSTKSTGYQFTIPDPDNRGFYTFSIYDLKKKTGETVQVALCELSPGVYATGLRDEKTEIQQSPTRKIV